MRRSFEARGAHRGKRPGDRASGTSMQMGAPPSDGVTRARDGVSTRAGGQGPSRRGWEGVDRMGGASPSKVGATNVVVVEQLVTGARKGHVARLHDVGARGDGERHLGVLLNE